MKTLNPLVVRIFINTSLARPVVQNGWAQRIPIYEQDWDAALPIAQAIVAAAANILASDCYIEWASLGMAEAPWWELALIDDPLYPLPQWSNSWADEAGWYWDFSDGMGQVQGRLFRALDEDELLGQTAEQWANALPDDITPLPLDLTTATKQELYANAFTTFREYFAVLRRLGKRVLGVQNYSLTPVQDIYFVQNRKRRIGGPWHRQSWEGVPYAEAPSFSPCGMVTGVGRRSFIVRCRFYEGGPVQLIHFYRAKIGAQVFPLPHIFWGRFTEQDLFNSFGPGELTGNTRRYWVNGEQFGKAPGLAYTGTEDQFLGETSVTWMPALPTPADLLPPCDNPGTKGGDMGYGGVCLGGAGIQWSRKQGATMLFPKMDACIAKIQTKNLSIDAYLRMPVRKTFEVSSLVAKREVKQYTADSIPANRHQANFSVDADIKSHPQKAFLTVSFIQAYNPTLAGLQGATSSSNVINWFSGTTAHNFIYVLAIVYSVGGVATLSMPAGWTVVNVFSNSICKMYATYISDAPAGLTGVTATITGSFTAMWWTFAEVSGMYRNSVLDKFSGISATSTSPSVGPTAPISQAKEWVACLFVPTSGTLNGTLGINPSFTFAGKSGIEMWGSKSVTGGGTQSAQLSTLPVGSSSNYQAMICTFS